MILLHFNKSEVFWFWNAITELSLYILQAYTMKCLLPFGIS